MTVSIDTKGVISKAFRIMALGKNALPPSTKLKRTETGFMFERGEAYGTINLQGNKDSLSLWISGGEGEGNRKTLDKEFSLKNYNDEREMLAAVLSEIQGDGDVWSSMARKGRARITRVADANTAASRSKPKPRSF